MRQDQIHEHDERFGQFLGFISDAWGHEMQPSARCKHCERTLSITEIVLGFKRDVNDFTTECPKCKRRFEATNLVDRRTGKEQRFWCALQTLERLPGKENMEVKEFEEKHPEIYFSAIFHFGSLLSAFKRVKIEYRREQFDWTSKAKLVLGQISDRDVSKIFGVSPTKVSEMREKLRIPKHRGKGSVIPADRQISLVA